MSPKIKNQDTTTEAVADNENRPAHAETVLDSSADASETKDAVNEKPSSSAVDDAATRARQRQERFKALQARAVSYCEAFPSRLVPRKA